MEHISVAMQKLQPDAVRHLRRQVSSATPTMVSQDANGMPTDRTICPSCRNHPGQTTDCTTCDGLGMVCPMCRGARLIAKHRHEDRIQTPYRPCDCMIPRYDNGKPVLSATGRHLYELDPQRELELISRYRDAVWRDDARAIALTP